MTKITDDEKEQMDKDMKEYHDMLNERVENDQKILAEVKKLVDAKHFKAIMEEVKEYSSYAFEIVDYHKGELDNDSGYNVYTDQIVNGGYCGDDYSGCVYFQIAKNKYLKWDYDCG